MPRYMVERIVADGLHISIDAQGAATCSTGVERTAEVGVHLGPCLLQSRLLREVTS